MSKSDIYVKRTEEYLEKLQKEIDFELVDVEFVKEASQYYLRVYCDMDKEGGISIDDCVEISRNISAWLKDFKRELGKEVELKTFKAINKQKEFSGILENFDADTLTIKIAGEDVKFSRNEIANVRLALDF